VPSGSRREAVTAFTTVLSEALACFAPNVHLLPLGYSQEVDAEAFTLLNVPLRNDTRERQVDLTLDMYYRTIEDQAGLWAVRTIEYSYGLERPTKAGEKPTPLVRWDWHPHVQGQRWPHMHVEDKRAKGSLITHKTHLVTGLVTLVDVLAYAIREHDVAIQQHRNDWRRRLRTAHITLQESMRWAAEDVGPI
jgi:hypothetical protein